MLEMKHQTINTDESKKRSKDGHERIELINQMKLKVKDIFCEHWLFKWLLTIFIHTARHKKAASSSVYYSRKKM